MKPSELPRWIEQAREGGADHVEVRRARKGGSPEPKLFCDEQVEGLQPDALIERLRDDAIIARKMREGQFELLALDKKREVMRERITVTRSDVDELEFGEDASAKLAAVAVREMQAMARVMCDAVKGSNVEIRETLKMVTEQNVNLHSKISDTIETAFTFATLRRESEAAETASKDKREMAKAALTELGPILGAVFMKLGKKSGPGLVAFFQSLREDQLAKVQEILSGEQMAVLSELVSQLQAEKDAAKKGKV
jgi:hypothetical protein